MRIGKKVSLAAGLMLVWLSAFARGEDAGDQQFRSVRAMGMGNAFGAVADDGDAFYYNPAGLTAVRKIRIDLQPVRFIPTQDFYHQLRDLDQLMDDINAITESKRPLEDPGLKDERRRLVDSMERLLSDDVGLDVAFPARFVVPFHIGDYGVAVGGLMHAWSRSQMEVQRRGLDWSDFVKDVLDDEVLYDVVAETSYGAAAAVEFPVSPLPLDLSLGLGARRIHRWRMTDEDDPLGIEDMINPYGKDGVEGTADDFKARYFDPDDLWDSMSEGRGYCVDVGAIGSLSDAINLGVAIQNLAGSVKYQEGRDEDLTRHFEASAAVNLTRLASPGIPTVDVILAASVDRFGKPRLGIEAIWDLPLLALSGRMGNNRGYMTLGAGIQFTFLDFDYAFYGDEEADWHAFSLNLAF